MNEYKPGWFYCCLNPEEEKMVDELGSAIDTKLIYQLQSNLSMGKKEVKCNKCGKVYPMIQICDKGQIYKPEEIPKLKTKPEKHKKAAMLFFGDHYYATNKKSLQRYKINKDGTETLCDETPIPTGVYNLAASETEKYIACVTFSETLSVLDTLEKKIVAKKRKSDSIGSPRFTFDGDERLLYFADSSIFSWSFLEDKTEVVWSASDGMSFICENITRNSATGNLLFFCMGRKTDEAVSYWKPYTIEVKGSTFVNMKPLKVGNTSLSHLVNSESLHCYSLLVDGSIRIFDEDMEEKEKIEVPYFIHFSNGGGIVPITKFDSDIPDLGKCYLSPDNRWLLLDYFSYVVLMEHASKAVRACLYNYNASPYTKMGFIDNNHFWYAHGDSTYIQDISELSGD